MDTTTNNFATDLLYEIKSSSKRWFIAFCIMVVLEICTIGGFMWYISLPIEETTVTQSLDGVDGENINQIGGDIYGESDSDYD